ncbi:MAG: NYN domain-containing protein [Patescibacteria group bacterium]
MAVIKQKSQRVGVFIDVQNMYYSAKNLYNCRVNFGNIVETAVADRQLVRAIAYVVRAGVPEEQAFFDALIKLGIETKEREVQVFLGGAKKADWDVGMVVDAIRLSPKLDVVVLVSGDGDFIPLVEYLQNMGVQTEVMAFRETSSSKLVEEVDDYIDLSKDQQRYLIPTRFTGRAPAAGKSQARAPKPAPTADDVDPNISALLDDSK